IPDKSSIILNPEINQIGISFVKDPSGRQLVVVIQAIADYVLITDLPSKADMYEVLPINGQVMGGYKFAWIGVAEKDPEPKERSEVEASPYFAPIDKVIYMDKTSNRAKQAAIAIGSIAAAVAAPFTYGASMILADILLQTVARTYQAQDVEVRGGINASYDGQFSASIGMGEWGAGLYYVTVWGYQKKQVLTEKKTPIILSRQVVEVE
ncbi:MAG TPA: hypothetical protein V6C96_03780, partial [Vampirovibrionales bacterium]